MKEKSGNSDNSNLMHHREITLKDGRYMIFYTFDESLSNAFTAKEKQRSEPLPTPEATEEKNV
jgi:hypothetical protein